MNHNVKSEGAEKKVSIIIVTHNTLDYVKPCLESVRTNSDDMHEIVIVDNASAKPTRDYVASMNQYPNTKVILNDENRLWSPANNQGVQAASSDSEFLLLLNSDVKVFSHEWLKCLQRPMHQYPRIGISGTQYNFVHYKPTYGAIDGCCFMIRRETLNEVGLLDEAYPWNGAGFVFTLDAWARGWYFYHVQDPGLLVHYGKRSRISNQTQLTNQKVNMKVVHAKTALTRKVDYLSYLLAMLGKFDVNRKINHCYAGAR